MSEIANKNTGKVTSFRSETMALQVPYGEEQHNVCEIVCFPFGNVLQTEYHSKCNYMCDSEETSSDTVGGVTAQTSLLVVVTDQNKLWTEITIKANVNSKLCKSKKKQKKSKTPPIKQKK